MARPIILWNKKPRICSDDAGTTILKSILPSPHPAPYEYMAGIDSNRLSYVPSLVYFCIKCLMEYPDQIHSLGPARLQYTKKPNSDPSTFDILRALIPSYDQSTSLVTVDPRLWATIAQIFSGLPPEFRRYKIPLSDPHLPLLQGIPSTADFTLLTIVELSGNRALTDDTIYSLKELHSLCALDASATPLSSYGLKVLARTMIYSDDLEQKVVNRRGPWGLRILNLRNCRNVDNDVSSAVEKFPLLSIVDVRGTMCTASFRPPGFRCSNEKTLFHPSSLSAALTALARSLETGQRQFTLTSHSKPFILSVSSLHHPEPPPRYSHYAVTPQDAFVVLNTPQRMGIQVGNTEKLRISTNAAERERAHEDNLDEWHGRNASLGDRNRQNHFYSDDVERWPLHRWGMWVDERQFDGSDMDTDDQNRDGDSEDGESDQSDDDADEEDEDKTVEGEIDSEEEDPGGDPDMDLRQFLEERGERVVEFMDSLASKSGLFPSKDARNEVENPNVSTSGSVAVPVPPYAIDNKTGEGSSPSCKIHDSPYSSTSGGGTVLQQPQLAADVATKGSEVNLSQSSKPVPGVDGTKTRVRAGRSVFPSSDGVKSNGRRLLETPRAITLFSGRTSQLEVGNVISDALPYGLMQGDPQTDEAQGRINLSNEQIPALTTPPPRIQNSADLTSSPPAGLARSRSRVPSSSAPSLRCTPMPKREQLVQCFVGHLPYTLPDDIISENRTDIRSPTFQTLSLLNEVSRSQQELVGLTDSVIAVESQANAARRAAESFYARTAKSETHLRHLSDLSQFHDSRDNPSHNQSLMLFRPPPPWSVLKQIKPTSAETGRKRRLDSDSLAHIVRSSGKGKAVMRSVEEMMNKRRKALADPTVKCGGRDGGVERRFSANPFRRKPGTTVQSIASQPRVQASEGQKENKPLKPILLSRTPSSTPRGYNNHKSGSCHAEDSRFESPILPDRQGAATPKERKIGSRPINNTQGGDQASVRLIATLPALFAASSSRLAVASQNKSIKPQKSLSGPNARNKEVKVGYDWKTWSTSSSTR